MLPTLLHLLGLPRPEGIDGRVLTEALLEAGDGAEPEVTEATHVSANESGATTRLSVSTVDGTPYINRAWVE